MKPANDAEPSLVQRLLALAERGVVALERLADTPRAPQTQPTRRQRRRPTIPAAETVTDEDRRAADAALGRARMVRR